MSYIGNSPIISAFPSDQYSGNGSTTAFTLSIAPANTASVIVVVSGILQDPTTYSVSGTTLTFSAAPPTGTNNISVRYLGIPAAGVVNTAFYSRNDYTATAGQTTFSVPSYTVPFIQVLRNGVMLGTVDYTATSGTSVVLANAATAGDLITVISFFVSSVLNAIPNNVNSVSDSNILAVSASKLSGQVPAANAPSGSIIQVVQASNTNTTSTTSSTYQDAGLTATITPKFATSRILILISTQTYLSGGAGAQIAFTIMKNTSTNIGATSGSFQAGFAPNTYSAAGAITSSVNISYVDSPATTSATSYGLWYYSYNGKAVNINGGNCSQTIQLLEVAA